MRRGREVQFKTVEGKLYGINLGSDFTAEHEWGIDDLKHEFGIPMDDKIMGIKRRTITAVPKKLVYHTQPKGPDFLALSRHNTPSLDDLSKNKELQDYRWKGDGKPPTAFTAAWSSRDFGIAAHSPEAKRLLADLYSAINEKDVAVMLAGGHVFHNAGLTFVVVSRLDEEYLEGLKESDLDAKRLKDAAEATGIAAELKKAGKGYYALSPSWDRQNPGQLVFWLNPMEQDQNNYGWFTVAQLREWSEGKGPIPKKPEPRRGRR